MIAKIAHELRSPLTSVKGFSATLVSRWDRFEDQQRFELVEAISYDADRMARIVSEVLDLARIESGRLELNLRDVPVQETVDAVLSDLRRQPGVERVQVAIPPNLTVRADPDRLQHVVFNVIENAVKFSQNDAIVVTGSTDGRAVTLSVADRGVGIPEERIATVFDGPGPAGQSATPSGTGLGLYLSRRLVEAHGGSLSVERREGSGSIFHIEIPVKVHVG